MIFKFAFPMMSLDNKSFYGAIVVCYDKEGYVGFEMLDYTQDHEWSKLNEND